MKDIRLKLNKRYVFSSDATKEYYKKHFFEIELIINGKKIYKFSEKKIK